MCENPSCHDYPVKSYLWVSAPIEQLSTILQNMVDIISLPNMRIWALRSWTLTNNELLWCRCFCHIIVIGIPCVGILYYPTIGGAVGMLGNYAVGGGSGSTLLAHRYQQGSLTLLASSLISPLPTITQTVSKSLLMSWRTTAPLGGPVASLSKSIHVPTPVKNYIRVGVYLYTNDRSSLLPHGRYANLDQKKTTTYTNTRQ